MSWLYGTLDELSSLTSGVSAPVTLGGFALQGHEVPNQIIVGGAQALAVHKLPGGGRIIDAMGSDEGSVAWRAAFVGPDAAQRARVLDVMRQQGAPVTLSFGDYTFAIIVTHYEYGYAARGAIVNYSIKGEIVSQNDETQLTETSLSLALQNDFSASISVMQNNAAEALVYAEVIDPVASKSLSVATSTLLSLASTLSSSTPTTSLPSSSSLQQSLDAIGASIQGAILNPPSNALGPTAISLSSCSASAIAFAAGQAAVLAALVQAGGYINRARANLAQETGRTTSPLVHA